MLINRVATLNQNIYFMFQVDDNSILSSQNDNDQDDISIDQEDENLIITSHNNNDQIV